ncbi:peptidoglycan editing factor PgeF [Pseudooceanicola sediminis]|uniref:Purine nucleoside phosphorylase n=1 Tax=Pseudooceanicola sediminis TaxID=2211117 RepID=A0A399J1D5_9RHOB|nr:peptidoglycan editing factor PgeF [Pseudooceanicola sediminis]KAA2315177.1 peptidoglycan editing factor PgeF [Puniceibacterium sp. HSS470]RII39031.1 peptidoglycan editing factor PgeF [Pseudooceanicola sediminis]|tara:strand:+ start:14879 stop:15634 length:756 start_codon:yes stop_codon:yes gene_type:complete
MALEILTSSALAPIRHGFFTRKGGASSGIFSGLNCGMESSDQAEIVSINRARVATAMDVEPGALTYVHQVHSARALPATGPFDTPPEADGIVTATPGVALSILTADCQPVLLADPQAQVIGAAHAGWRGAIDGVLESTIDAMVDLGADRARITAAIGPSISQRAYEVGPEFLDDFMVDDPDNTRFFANGEGDRYLFDLPAYGLHRLRSAGIAQAEWIGHCTYSDPDRFFSYRRTTHEGQADYGRLISVIRL